MKKKKQLFYGMGVVGALVVPISTLISCGELSPEETNGQKAVDNIDGVQVKAAIYKLYAPEQNSLLPSEILIKIPAQEVKITNVDATVKFTPTADDPNGEIKYVVTEVSKTITTSEGVVVTVKRDNPEDLNGFIGNLPNTTHVENVKNFLADPITAKAKIETVINSYYQDDKGLSPIGAIAKKPKNEVTTTDEGILIKFVPTSDQTTAGSKITYTISSVSKGNYIVTDLTKFTELSGEITGFVSSQTLLDGITNDDVLNNLFPTLTNIDKLTKPADKTDLTLNTEPLLTLKTENWKDNESPITFDVVITSQVDTTITRTIPNLKYDVKVNLLTDKLQSTEPLFNSTPEIAANMNQKGFIEVGKDKFLLAPSSEDAGFQLITVDPQSPDKYIASKVSWASYPPEKWLNLNDVGVVEAAIAPAGIIDDTNSLANGDPQFLIASGKKGIVIAALQEGDSKFAALPIEFDTSTSAAASITALSDVNTKGALLQALPTSKVGDLAFLVSTKANGTHIIYHHSVQGGAGTWQVNPISEEAGEASTMFDGAAGAFSVIEPLGDPQDGKFLMSLDHTTYGATTPTYVVLTYTPTTGNKESGFTIKAVDDQNGAAKFLNLPLDGKQVPIINLGNNKFLFGTNTVGLVEATYNPTDDSFTSNILNKQTDLGNLEDFIAPYSTTGTNNIMSGGSLTFLGDNEYLVGTSTKGFVTLSYDPGDDKFRSKNTTAAAGGDVTPLTTATNGAGSQSFKLKDNYFLVATLEDGFQIVQGPVDYSYTLSS